MRNTKHFAAMSNPALNPGFRRTWTEPSHCNNPSIVGSAAAEIVADMQFRQMVERVHALGARAVGELLAELSVERGIRTVVDRKLAIYAELDPKVIEAVEAAGFWPAPIREIRS